MAPLSRIAPVVTGPALPDCVKSISTTPGRVAPVTASSSSAKVPGARVSSPTVTGSSTAWPVPSCAMPPSTIDVTSNSLTPPMDASPLRPDIFR